VSPSKKLRDLRDPNDTWWTPDAAAEHFGVTRGAVLRWIREEKVPVYGKSKLMKREDILAAFRARRQRQLATRLKPQNDGPAQS
jgi:hypothetical protein